MLSNYSKDFCRLYTCIFVKCLGYNLARFLYFCRCKFIYEPQIQNKDRKENLKLYLKLLIFMPTFCICGGFIVTEFYRNWLKYTYYTERVLCSRGSV